MVPFSPCGDPGVTSPLNGDITAMKMAPMMTNDGAIGANGDGVHYNWRHHRHHHWRHSTMARHLLHFSRNLIGGISNSYNTFTLFIRGGSKKQAILSISTHERRIEFHLRSNTLMIDT